MTNNTKPLPVHKDLLYYAGIITFIGILLVFYSASSNSNLMITAIITTSILGVLTYFMWDTRCSKCKRVFVLKHISNEILKKWEEKRQYKPKTIYYYSDGETIKDEKYGNSKTFIAKFEKHKNGYKCKKCNNIQHKITNLFLNKNDWERVNIPNTKTTKTKLPKEHHNNFNSDFSIDSFNDSYYYDDSSSKKKRRTIPKTLKMSIWKKYNGKKYNGKCYVCKKNINTHQFEAGHVKPVSKGGSDRIENLRPICMGCNRSMGNRNLYSYKKQYHN